MRYTSGRFISLLKLNRLMKSLLKIFILFLIVLSPLEITRCILEEAN